MMVSRGSCDFGGNRNGHGPDKGGKREKVSTPPGHVVSRQAMNRMNLAPYLGQGGDPQSVGEDVPMRMNDVGLESVDCPTQAREHAGVESTAFAQMKNGDLSPEEKLLEMRALSAK
jgi:hypothetical protein